MGRTLSRFVVLLFFVLSAAVEAQTQDTKIAFWVQSIPPPGRTACVQLGVFLRVEAGPPVWHGFSVTVDYSANTSFLAATPYARGSSFIPMTEPGLTRPGTHQPPHGGPPPTTCVSSSIINSVVLGGGSCIAFIPGNGMVMVSEKVSQMTMETGRIYIVGGSEISIPPNQDLLLAVLTFPVTGNPGEVRVDFPSPMSSSNALFDLNMMPHAAATTGGGILTTTETTSVPTLSQWGLIVFFAGLLVSAFFMLRRPSVSA
jgi:hypothetical protein